MALELEICGTSQRGWLLLKLGVKFLLDRGLDVDVFVIALATEYSRLLLGPDIERLQEPLSSDLLEGRENLVPRSGAVEEYGLRLVPDQKLQRLVQHGDWLERVDGKGII